MSGKEIVSLVILFTLARLNGTFLDLHVVLSTNQAVNHGKRNSNTYAINGDFCKI